LNWKFWKRKKKEKVMKGAWRYAKDGITKVPIED